MRFRHSSPFTRVDPVHIHTSGIFELTSSHLCADANNEEEEEEEEVKPVRVLRKPPPPRQPSEHVPPPEDPPTPPDEPEEDTTADTGPHVGEEDPSGTDGDGHAGEDDGDVGDEPDENGDADDGHEWPEEVATTTQDTDTEAEGGVNAHAEEAGHARRKSLRTLPTEGPVMCACVCICRWGSGVFYR